MNQGKGPISWILLQDSLDYLHNLSIHFNEFESSGLKDLEHNLQIIEKVFPYRLFMSPGLIVLNKQCSICGLDPDDPKCSHVQGRLYNGKIANTIITNAKFVEMSLTDRPEDKRNIITKPVPDFKNVQKLIKEMKSPLTVIKLCDIHERNHINITDMRIQLVFSLDRKCMLT